MALNQVVLPGFAAYRLGTSTSKAGIQKGASDADDEAVDSADDEEEAPAADGPRG
jgi:hypothetical protein